jgi:hypothetical protein
VTAVPVLHPQATPAVKDLRYIDPNFTRNIIGLRPPVNGVPREQIKVPISPRADVTDELLFEDPTTPSTIYCLPRYKLAVNKNKKDHYEVALHQDESGWSLVVGMTKFFAPSIAAAAKTAKEINHHVAVLLRCNQMIGNQVGAQEELSFQEVTFAEGILRATLRLDSVEQRDLVYQALTDHSLGAALVVRRAITVGIPVPQLPIQRLPFQIMQPVALRVPSPTPAVAAGPAPAKPAAPTFLQADRVVDQIADPRPFVFSPSLHGYIFSGVTPSSTESSQLTRYQVPWGDGRSHTYYQDGARKEVFYNLPDSFKIARRPDGAHEPLMSVKFGPASSAEDLKVTFSFVAVPYVDPARLKDAAGKLKAAITDPLPKGVAGPQFDPLLAAPGKTHFSLAYPGSDTTKGPFELRSQAIVDLRSGIHDSLSMSLTQFQSIYDAMFSTSSLLLTGKVDVDLGSDAGEEIPFTARMNDLVGDVFSYSEQSLDPNQGDEAAGDATQSPSGGNGALEDSVKSAVGDAIGGDFKTAATDLAVGVAGSLLNKLVHGGKDGKDKKKKGKKPAQKQALEQGVQATFQNVIESPVEIQSLGASLARDTEIIPASVQGMDLSQPAQIAPAQQLTVNVTPDQSTPKAGRVKAVFDMSGVHSVPDKEAIWNAILDPSTSDSYLTSITVKTPASTFAVPSDDPGRQVVSLVVDFDSGVSAELKADKLEAKVDIPHPVVNFVLRKTDTGEYRYKRTLVRANGEQARDDDWRPPETTTVLFPAVE